MKADATLYLRRKTLQRTLSRMTLAAFVLFAVFSVAVARAASANDKPRDRATRLMRAGEYAEAEKIYRELLVKNPRDESARLGLAQVLLKQRIYGEAYDQATRVLAANRTSSRAYAVVGSTLLAAGNFSSAAQAFRDALTLREDDALAIAGLGEIDFYENRLPDALNKLRRATYLDPYEPDYQYMLAQTSARHERFNEAADAYERFLKIAPPSDSDRRDRIRGLIAFLRFLGTQRSLYQISNDRAPIVIPFEVVNNRPVLTVRVNDRKETLRFVLDTGSGMCVVSDTTARRLGLHEVARGGKARAVGGDGRFEVVYGFLQSLHLDGATLDDNRDAQARIDNVPVYIRPFPNAAEPVDGYIGLTALSKYLATLDYTARELTLRRIEKRAPTAVDSSAASGFELPIRTTSSGFWSGEVRLAGVEGAMNFIIDTGASISVVSQAATQREELERMKQKTRIRVFGAAGVTEGVPMLLIPHVKLGSHAQPNVSAVVLDLDAINETAGFEQTGIIGGNVLRHFRLTFDFSRNMLRFEPPNVNNNAGPKSQVSSVLRKN